MYVCHVITGPSCKLDAWVSIKIVLIKVNHLINAKKILFFPFQWQQQLLRQLRTLQLSLVTFLSTQHCSDITSVEFPFVSHVHAICFPVVIIVILLTIAVLAFLLYRYLCHNKGAYRTTGELAPGEDPDEDFTNQTSSEKKEYFI